MAGDDRGAGYIRLYRKLRENPMWIESEPFDKRSAWIDILLSVRWGEEPSRSVVNGRILEFGRGECGYSLETWAKRWGWSKEKVRRYFNLLKKLGQIETENGAYGTTRLTVCNFNSYQDSRHAPDTQLNGKSRVVLKKSAKNDTHPDTHTDTHPTQLSSCGSDVCDTSKHTVETLTDTHPDTHPTRTRHAPDTHPDTNIRREEGEEGEEGKKGKKERGAGAPRAFSLADACGLLAEDRFRVLATAGFEAGFRNWLAYRLSSKRKPTLRAAELNLLDALKTGPEVAVAMMEAAEKNGWTGWYFPEQVDRYRAQVAPRPKVVSKKSPLVLAAMRQAEMHAEAARKFEEAARLREMNKEVSIER